MRCIERVGRGQYSILTLGYTTTTTNNIRLVTLADHTSDHGNKTNSSKKEGYTNNTNNNQIEGLLSRVY